MCVVRDCGSKGITNLTAQISFLHVQTFSMLLCISHSLEKITVPLAHFKKRAEVNIDHILSPQ